MKEDPKAFTLQGRMSSPGRFAHLLTDLPRGIADLVRLVQGATIHIFWAERYGFNPSSERQAEVQLRTMERRLERMMELDPRPIHEPRPVERKLIGNCRDHSLMLTMLLREQGLPARARCGFGAYFAPDWFEDHWVCEYWDAAQSRWVLVDAQLDELQCRALDIRFDPLDVPRDQFIVGGLAWQLCRSGQADPQKFGIADMHGLWFVRGDFIRDVAALNAMELLPWDCWGLIETAEEELRDEDLRFLDELARLTCGDVPEAGRVRELYRNDPRLRVPAEIHSFTPAGPQSVALG